MLAGRGVRRFCCTHVGTKVVRYFAFVLKCELIGDSINHMAMLTSELVVMNAFYVLLALTSAEVGRRYKAPPTLLGGKGKQSTSESIPSRIMECVFIIWTCLYIAILICVLWTLVQMQSANIRYLCSWFVILQMAFYISFLASYAASMDNICRLIDDLLFPIINALAWIVCVVCLVDGQNYAEFKDIRYFIVHILPFIAASFYEINIYRNGKFAMPAKRTNYFTAFWKIYCPAVFLTLYAFNNDHNEVYRDHLGSSRPWFVVTVGVLSNVRLVYFPIDVGR